MILPHTADGKFLAFGGTLEEAFANSALAMSSFMWDWDKIKPMRTINMNISGRDLEQLLVKFLNEIIYQNEMNRFLLGRVENITIRKTATGFQLEACISGDIMNDYYEITGVVKAATYSEIGILENADGFAIQVVVDL